MKKRMKMIGIIFAVILIGSLNIFNVSAINGCKDLTTKRFCENGCIMQEGKDACSKEFSCIWNETQYGNYCNTDTLTYVVCGDAVDIPSQVPGIISFAVNLLKIATPIILIIVSIITLVKAIIASKEDEIKKAQSSLVKKLLAAAMVFFIVSIVQFVILKVADSSDANGISKCMSCFLNNDCDKNVYYKTMMGSKYKCTYISNGKEFDCN